LKNYIYNLQVVAVRWEVMCCTEYFTNPRSLQERFWVQYTILSLL